VFFLACCFSLVTQHSLRADLPSIETEFHLAWAWSVTGDGIGIKGLEVVDLDGDGRSEILVATEPGSDDGYWYILEHQKGALVQTFSALPRADGLMGLATGAEAGGIRVVVAGRSSLTVYDGATLRELATFPTPYAFDKVLAVGDVEADGILDAVLCDAADLYVYELLLGTVRTKLGFGCSDLALGQTDSDPQLEIAIAGNPAGGFVLDGASLDVDWAVPSGFGSRLCLGNFDADERDEVASLVTGGGIRVQDPETGDAIWEAPALDAFVLAAANLDSEAGSELVWSAVQWGPIHILDGATPAELGIVESPESVVMKIAAGDTDSDGLPNLLWATGYLSSAPDYLWVARSDTWAIETRTDDWRGPFIGIGVGDFEGGGSLEVATAAPQRESGYAGGAPLILSFATGRLKRAAPPEWGGQTPNYLHGLTSAQLDTDAQLEFCLYSGYGVGCFDGRDFSEQWWADLGGSNDALAIAELDGAGFPEILVANGQALIYAFEGESGWFKWRNPPVTPWYPGIYRLSFINVVGDSREEVLATTAFGPESRIWAFDAETGLVVAGPWTTDVLSLAPAPSPSAPSQLLLGRSNGEILPFDMTTGTAGAAIVTFPNAVLAFGFADFDRDGGVDVAALLADHFEVEDGESGLTLYVGPHLGSFGVHAESFRVGDFDGNTVPEILIGTDSGVALFRAPLYVVFVDGFESGDTSNW